MSYQSICRGLYKKASSEQLKKLASLIGMRKKAEKVLPPGHPMAQWSKNIGYEPVEKEISEANKRSLDLYDEVSADGLHELNPYGSENSSQAANKFAEYWKAIHNFKKNVFNRTGKFPSYKELQDFVPQGWTPGKDRQYWDNTKEFLRERLKQLKDAVPAAPGKYQDWLQHPTRAIWDLAESRKKTSNPVA